MARWLTVAEVAEYLRCGERTVRDLMANNQIPHVIFAGRALFNTDRLDEWLLSMERGPLSDRLGKGPVTGALEGPAIEKEVEVLPDYPKDKVADIITEFAAYPRDEFVHRLGRNLKEDLDCIHPDVPGRVFLSSKVFNQLARWCHPKRHSEREKWVQPRAEEISKLLFGRIIDRV